MRETIVVPAAKLHRSDRLSLDQLALVETLGIGAHAVDRARLDPGEFALVVGTGPIGLAALQFAKIAGARAIALDVNADRLAFCRDTLGVEDCVMADGGEVEAIATITAGEMPLTVFDCTGNPASMMRSFDLIAQGGTLVFVGLFQGDVTFSDPELPPSRDDIASLSKRHGRRLPPDHRPDRGRRD